MGVFQEKELKQLGIILVLVLMLLQSQGDCQARHKTILINGQAFILEIADTQAKREAGLSGRHIKENEGMLFIMDEPGRPHFWMKGCLEPLDMIWVDEEGFVTEMDENARVCSGLDCVIYMPLHDTKYVVELKGGAARKAGLRIGQKLEIED